MARLEKNADPQPQTEWAETLPGFVREVSWLRWLLPLSAEPTEAIPVLDEEEETAATTA